MEKKEQKPELKTKGARRCYVEKTSISPPDGRQTPARREARNHRSEDAKMLGGPFSAWAVLTSGMRAGGTRIEPEIPQIPAVRCFFAPRSDREAQTTKQRP